MEKPEISIILPGIRPYNWSKLYDSIVKSTTRRFELIVVGPYRPPDMLQNDIYNFKYVKDYGSPMRASNFLSDDWWLFNVAIMHRSFFDSLGAWDCSFEACPMGHTDLAIRAQHAGANVAMSEFPLLDCGHMPGTTGDHAPIHYAQLGHDTPRFQQRYRDPEWVNKSTKIDINNWKNSPTMKYEEILI